jgi:hypothetical protein
MNISNVTRTPNFSTTSHANAQPPKNTIARRTLLIHAHHPSPCPELEQYFAHHEAPEKTKPLSAKQVQVVADWCIEHSEIDVLAQALKDHRSTTVAWIDIGARVVINHRLVNALDILQDMGAPHGVRVNSHEEISWLPHYLESPHATGLYVTCKGPFDAVSEDLIKALGHAESLQEVNFQSLIFDNKALGDDVLKAITECPSHIEKLTLLHLVCETTDILHHLLHKDSLQSVEIKPAASEKGAEAFANAFLYSEFGTRDFIIHDCPLEILQLAKQPKVSLMLPIEGKPHALSHLEIRTLPERFANVEYCLLSTHKEDFQSPEQQALSQTTEKELKSAIEIRNEVIKYFYDQASIKRVEAEWSVRQTRLFGVSMQLRKQHFSEDLYELLNKREADKVNLNFDGRQLNEDNAQSVLSILRGFESLKTLSLDFQQVDIKFSGKLLAGLPSIIKTLPQLTLGGVEFNRGQALSAMEEIRGLDKLKNNPHMKPHLPAILGAMGISYT